MSVVDQEAPLSTLAAYSARPTVQVDGQTLPVVQEQLRTCVVSEAEGGLTTLSLGLSNWGTTDGAIGQLFDAGGPIALGSRLKVYFGDASAPRELFDGEVHALEARASIGGPPELVVLAEDALYALRGARRTAVYEDQSLADVVRAIADRHGLAVDLGDLPSATGTHAQLNESDLAFLRRLLARADADLQISGGQLQVRPAGDSERGTVSLTLYSQLQQVRVIADLAQQVSQVSASGFDVGQGRAYTASSSGAHLGAGSGTAGANLLPGNGSRSEHLAPLACRNETEAQALVDATFDQRARRFVRLHGSAQGNAELRVGTRVRISGVARRFDNTYAVVEAHHRFDSVSGYRTDFIAQCAYLSQP